MQKNRPHDELRLLSFSSSTFPLFSTLLLLFLLFLLQKMEKVQQFVSNKLGKSEISRNQKTWQQTIDVTNGDQRVKFLHLLFFADSVCSPPFFRIAFSLCFRHLLVGQGCYATTLCPYSDLQHLAGVSSHVFRENLKTWKILEDTWRPSQYSRCLFRRFGSCTSQSCRHRSGLRLCPF